jgi:hypothetical protein
MARRNDPVQMVLDIFKIIVITIVGFIIIKVLLSALASV